MISGSKPSTLAWTAVHLLYPLLPVFLEALIRLGAMDWHLSADTVNAATLAISAGLLSVFVNQSLRGQETPLPDDAEKDARNGACVYFMTIGICFFALFGLVVLLHTLVIDRQFTQLKPVLRGFQFMVFLGSSVPVVSAIVAQKSFKLRASLI
jgi:hypothetical protein